MKGLIETPPRCSCCEKPLTLVKELKLGSLCGKLQRILAEGFGRNTQIFIDDGEELLCVAY